jgi:hypothetical protein
MANDHVKMFTEEYSPIAVQVGKQIGVSPTVLLAQWGMETDYGRKVPGHFNLGNIKDMSGAGASAVDNKSKTKDNYVNFESPEAFGDYYANMMRRLYPKALNTGDDITKYAQGLRTGVKGSYAEDEGYEQAIRGAHKLTSNFYAGAGDGEKKSENPFEGYESESSKLKREQEEAEKNKPPAVVNPDDKQGGINAPEVGAIAGAATNLLFPPMTNPELPPKIDTSKAQERATEAADKLELARRNLEVAVPQGADNLEETFRQSQGELERLKNEQRLAQEHLRGLPRTPPVVEPPAPSSPFPQVIRTGPASGAPVEGDSGVRNWTIKSAGQKHQMPEAILDIVTDQTKDSPTGGKRLIEEDLKNLEKIKKLGAGDYGLVTTEGGVQLQLPPTTVAERQADIDRQNQASQAELAQKTEQARLQQEAQARAFQQQQATYEAELKRLRQERAAAGQQHNVVTGQKRTAAPLQRALTKAETDAEVARRRLARAQEQPNALVRPLDAAGVKTAKMGALPRTVVGGGAGYLGVMSYQEALARFKAGDTSEGVLKALEAGSAAAALLPPAGKTITRTRGAGVLGGLGLGTYELGKRLLKERPPEE